MQIVIPYYHTSDSPTADQKKKLLNFKYNTCILLQFWLIVSFNMFDYIWHVLEITVINGIKESLTKLELKLAGQERKLFFMTKMIINLKTTCAMKRYLCPDFSVDI